MTPIRTPKMTPINRNFPVPRKWAFGSGRARSYFKPKPAVPKPKAPAIGLSGRRKPVKSPIKHFKISWAEIETGWRKLYRQISNSGRTYDAVVCLTQGGFLLGQIMASKFHLPLGIVRSQRYGTEETGKKTFVDGRVTWTDRGRRSPGKILLVDDLIDEGHSIKRVIEMLQKRYPHVSPKEIDLCVLFTKPTHLEVDLSSHRLFQHKRINRFVDFPWETGEVPDKPMG